LHGFQTKTCDFHAIMTLPSTHPSQRLGLVVSCLGWGTHALAPLSFKSTTYSGVFTLHPLLTGEGRGHHGVIIHEATKLAEAGKLTPRVDARESDLARVEAAYDILIGVHQGLRESSSSRSAKHRITKSSVRFFSSVRLFRSVT
jgi:hypothetical protein